jgi:hypothetical protein
MKTPHKHAAVIKAWADGAQVQVNVGTENKKDWRDIPDPVWNATEYRVKPDPLTYRLCLCKDYMGHYYIGSFNKGFGQTVEECERGAGFVKWLDTDWQEVEV